MQSEVINKTNINIAILQGMISIAKVDGIVLTRLEPLINYFLTEKQYPEGYANLKNILETPFIPEQIGKGLRLELLEFFFSSCLLVAFIDGFSKAEETLLREYAALMDFPETTLDNLISSIGNEMAKVFDQDILYWFTRMVNGYLKYLESGNTPFDAFYSFRLLHFLTNGRLNDIMGFIAAIINPPYISGIRDLVMDETGVAEIINFSNIAPVVNEIQNNGYAVMEKILPDELCDKLLAFAQITPCYPLLPDQEYADSYNGPRFIHDSSNPRAARSDFDIKDIIEISAVQELIASPFFLTIAQSYFAAKPVLNSVTMWWSDNYPGKTSRYTGQVFHVDMDRPKFLLFFIYLTDVGLKNGPHIYLPGTHKQKPLDLLVDKRMTDEELLKYYDRDKFVEITGRRGTVIAGDTRAFHKGKPVEEGSRLMLQITFSTDLFGEAITKLRINNPSEKIKVMQEKYPFVFSNFFI